MKVIKFVTTFLLLISLRIFISYADIKYNNWTSNFVETFEETNAKFKFYDIKINYTINGNLSENEVQNMFINLAESLNVDEKKIKMWKKLFQCSAEDSGAACFLQCIGANAASAANYFPANAVSAYDVYCA